MRRPRRKHLAPFIAPLRPLIGKGGREYLATLINPSRKTHIPPTLKVSDFFRTADAEGLRIVVLRWFDDLPHIDPGRDLDILVPDGAVTRIQTFLSCWPQGQRVDCYSETGVGGTGCLPQSTGNVPAFPAEIAAKILETAQQRQGGWWVPAPREHVLALAYHAVYLKGYASGLRPDARTPALAEGSHDYAAVLTQLAARADIALEKPVTMASVDRMLSREGWRPPVDHLRQLAAHNPWIGSELL